MALNKSENWQILDLFFKKNVILANGLFINGGFPVLITKIIEINRKLIIICDTLKMNDNKWDWIWNKIIVI